MRTRQLASSSLCAKVGPGKPVADLAAAGMTATLARRQEKPMMFIAMNRFRVKKGSEQAFEDVWLNRDSQLTKVPGFVEFHLLKGPEHDDFTLYASHTIWTSKTTFEAWTKSEAFRAVHKDAGQNKPLYLDHPQFEGFEVRQTVERSKAAVA
jgi:heme-degrading monooxygenase HmoA